jgi:Xaa-Pro dipeptidase
VSENNYAVAREKMAQAAEQMRRERIDSWLLLSREGTDPAMPLLVGAKAVHAAAVFVDPDEKHTILTSRSDAAHFSETGLFSEVIVYEADLREAFRDEMARRAPRSLALNISEHDHLCDGLTRGMYLWIAETLGARELKSIECSSEDILARLRSIKTPTELDLIRRAVTATCDIYDEVSRGIRCGMSEIEIGDLFTGSMKRRGVVNGITHRLSYPLICLIRAGLAHREPGKHQSIPGDMMVVDFSVDVGGYTSDIARTFYFLKEGESQAPEDVQKAFDTTVKAVHTVIAGIQAGMAGHEVDKVGRDVIEDAGYPTIRHSVGHQIGREVHDGGTVLGPQRTPRRPVVEGILAEGEVYAIEPTVIQDDGKASCIVEENIILTSSGPDVMSRPQRALYLIPAPESDA